MEGGAEELDFFGHDSGVVGGEDGGGDDEGVSGVRPIVESPSANDMRVRRCFHRREWSVNIEEKGRERGWVFLTQR